MATEKLDLRELRSKLVCTLLFIYKASRQSIQHHLNDSVRCLNLVNLLRFHFLIQLGIYLSIFIRKRSFQEYVSFFCNPGRNPGIVRNSGKKM